ncbi:MAG: hypothetical protein R6W90_16910 [Ignavibacteriaceae bacterium]
MEQINFYTTMKQTIILWMGAFVIVFLAGYLNSVISGDYPVTGTIGIDAQKVSYRFDKKYYTGDSYKVLVRSDIKDLDAEVQWKRRYDKQWNKIEMKQSGDFLSANLPKFNINDVVEYRVMVQRDNRTYLLPANKPVVMEFSGKAPKTITVVYYLTLFAGLLFSTRTGLEYFKERDKIKRFAFLTLAFFFLYNFIAPVNTTFAIDAANKSVPPITKLFDIQSIVFLLLWIAGMWGAFKAKKPKLFVLIISILTILVFLLVRV